MNSFLKVEFESFVSLFFCRFVCDGEISWAKYMRCDEHRNRKKVKRVSMESYGSIFLKTF
jgi:hypothetical protein